MVAMLAFGGTYAYFTATATAINGGSVKTATVVLKGKDVAVTTGTVADIVPGQEAFDEDLSVQAKHASTTDTYVFVQMSTDNKMLVDGTTTGESVFQLTTDYTDATNGTTWTKLTGEGVPSDVYYIKAAKVDAETALAAFVYNVTFNSAVQAKKVEDAEGNITEANNVYTLGENSAKVPATTIEGITVNVTLNFSAIQQHNFGTALLAWNAIQNQGTPSVS